MQKISAHIVLLILSCVWFSPGFGQDFSCPGLGNYPIYDGACLGGYYYCYEGGFIYQGCDGDLLFDPLEGECVDAELASCNDPTGTRPSTTPRPTTTTGSTTTGTPTTTTTPAPTTTTPSGPTTTTRKPGSNCPEKCVCPGDGDWFLIGVCGPEYYSCTNGVPTDKICPQGEVFDPAIRKCTTCATATCTPGNPADCNP